MKKNQMLSLLLAAVIFCFLSAPSAILADGDFVLNDDGTALTKYNGKASFVSVPEGVRVIRYGAFTGNKAVNTVYLADSVTEIEGGAFENCYNLQNIIVSGSSKLSYIGAYAFAGCPQLNESFVPVGASCDNAFSSRKAEQPAAAKDDSAANPGQSSGNTASKPDQTTEGNTQQSAARNSTASADIGAWEQEDGSVLVIWAPMENVIEYELYRSENGGNPILIKILTDTMYTDFELNLSKNDYSYFVKAGGSVPGEMSEAVPVERIPQAQPGFEKNGIGYTIISADVVDTDMFYEILEKNTQLKRDDVKNFVVVTAYRSNDQNPRIPIAVSNNGAYYGVIAIGPNVFRNNRTLKTITLPSSIQVIETGAFAYCNAMIDQ